MKTKNLLTLAIVGTLLFGITSAASDNIHYKTVDGTGTITICDPDSNGTKCITMKDKNEGATESGIFMCIQHYSCEEKRKKYIYEDYNSLEDCVDDEYSEEECLSRYYDSADECISDGMRISDCLGRSFYGDTFTSEEDCNNRSESLYDECINLSSTGVWGSHYQWGNNHGFVPGEEGSYNFPGGESTGGKINCGGYSPTTPLNTNIFVVSEFGDYCNSMNNNLRGGQSDSSDNNRGYDITGNVVANVTGRQGPCPTGYHVPSAGEWSKLLEYRAANYTGDGNNLTLQSSSTNGLKYFSDIFGAADFASHFKIPFAGRRGSNSKFYDTNQYAVLWSSSPMINNSQAYYFRVYSDSAFNDYTYRSNGFSVRCFKNYALTFPIVETTDDENFTVTIGGDTYTGLEEIMEVRTNNIEEETMENKPVVGEVSVSFGSNESAKFNKLVQINIPVEDEEQVIVKVKHEGSSEYNYDGLTTNANASCNDNGRPTSSQYNGAPITVVNGFASIYTCEASSFVALGLGSGEAIGEVTLTLTAGENTCTLNDYNLGTHNVSSEDQNVSTSGQNIVCEFLKNPGATIQLSMGDLADGTKEIGRQYFTGIVTSLGNSLGTIANLTGGSYNFLSSHVIYTKEANTIGTWTGSLAIEGIIPAGTPSGEYTGELNIIICEGC